MQNAQLLQQYEDLKTEDNLLSLIREGIREGLHYEYKRKSDPSKPDLSDSDKKNLSKSLTSFANSDGGLLIWGITTQGNGDTKLPEKLDPITEIHEFEKRLNNFIPEGIQLPIENLISGVIYSKESKNAGYLKFYIPSSDLTPHRSSSKDAEYDHYYARNSEGCYRMPHYQVSDMFGRRQKPDLVLDISAKEQTVDDTRVWDIDFRLRNEGRAMARFYGYFCKFDKNIRIVHVREVDDSTSHNDGVPTISFSNNVGVIHPNGVTYNCGGVRIKNEDPTKKVTGTISFFCDNMITKTKELEIGVVGI